MRWGAAALAVLCLAGCRHQAAPGEQAPGEQAAASEQAAATETGGSQAAEPGKLGTPFAPPVAPPAPAEALNHFAQVCIHEPPPPTADEAGDRAATCLGDVLETLRAAIGVGGVPEAQVGSELDTAELAVHDLADDPTATDAAARAQQAATGLVSLAEAVNAALDMPRPDAAQAAGRAVDALSPDRPLAAQGPALLSLFKALDGVVRPLVHDLGIEPAPAAPAAANGG